jgi:transcriptional regulator with XRE-family HTH domain
MRTNLPRAIRALRIRRGWRQADLAAISGVSREMVSRVERGAVDGITTRALNRVARALDATLAVELRWRGADLDALIDRVHASVQDEAAARLARLGWDGRAEVAFNQYGDRGSCDLVAWHGRSRTLLIVEVKSRIGNLQELLRRLDVKVRLGGHIAGQLGYPRPRAVVRALVIAEGHAARTIVRRHPALFAPFQLRGRAAFRWLLAPSAGAAQTGLLWFEQLPNSRDGVTNSVERVRRRASAAPRAH